MKEIEDENIIEKAPDRLEILKRIEKLEKEGKFDVDPEDDPPTIPLEVGKVDYLRKKSTSRIKSKIADKLAVTFFNSLVDDNKVIIKDVNGIENLKSIHSNTGCIVTCNHFNPFDSFTVEKIFRLTKKQRRQKMYKVIREGNYTNFPGFYGFLMRNCYTLPLSQNTSTMVEFIKAVDTLLKRGDYILIFPEQSLWWNYKKPKPLKPGAFKLAARNSVPVLPMFITMEDTDKIGDDGFPIQAYTVNIAEPIYPDKSKSDKENTQWMMEKNFQDWKKIYEDFYKTPLVYSTEEKERIQTEKDLDALEGNS